MGDGIPAELRDVTTPDYAGAKLSKRAVAEEKEQRYSSSKVVGFSFQVAAFL